MATAFEIVLLGTGSPLPNPERCGAGQVIIAGDTRVMVDVGWGATRRLFAAGIPAPMIDVVCYTHLHSDHISDTADLLIMRWAGGAQKPLEIYGPVGTKAMMDGFLAAMSADIGYRFAHHPGKLSKEGIVCNVHEVPATADRSRIAEIGGLTIDAFEVDHFPVVPALGFRFERGGKSLVLSGDTKKCDNLVRAARDADMFVSEAMNAGMFKIMIQNLRNMGNEHTASVMEDVPSYHSTTLEVAEMARDAGVKHLVLSHLLPTPPSEGPIVDNFTNGMAEIYSGPITVGRDLQRFSIE
jgi:ribonuclease Z